MQFTAAQAAVFISHERIYQHVWKDKKDGGTLYLHLRHSGKKYNRRKGRNSGRGLIPNRVDIDQRPPIVAAKSRIGDWEADTIIGANHIRRGSSSKRRHRVGRASRRSAISSTATSRLATSMRARP